MNATVQLVVNGHRKKFPLERAEGILRTQAANPGLEGYVLPDDSDYEFHNDALRRRSPRPADKPQESDGKG